MITKPTMKSFSYLLFLLVSCSYATIAWDIRQGVLPVWSDEFFYYINAMNYSLHGSLEAALTYTGKGAHILGGDAHGFMYSLFHGAIAHVIGFYPSSLPYTNMLLVVMAVVIIFKFSACKPPDTFMLATVLLSYISVVMYTFTFMQEAIHLLIAVCCSLLLIKIYTYKNTGSIIAFMLILIVAALFRNLWLFWTICLLPLAKTKKEFALYLFIFFASSIVSLLISQYLWDAIPSAFGNAMTFAKSGQITKTISLLQSNFIENCKACLYEESRGLLYFIGQWVYIPIFIYSCYLYYRTRERIYLALVLVYSVSFVLLMVCFIVGSWGEIRTMAPLYYLFVIVIFQSSKRLPVFVLLSLSLITLPGNFAAAKNWINEKKTQSVIYSKESSIMTSVRSIGNAIDNNRTSLILMDYIPADYSRDLLYLPLQSKYGQKIKYAVNYFGTDVSAVRYDYILTKHQIIGSRNYMHVQTADTLFLYKIVDL